MMIPEIKRKKDSQIKMKKTILKHRLQRNSIKVIKIKINHRSNISKWMDRLKATLIKVTTKICKMLRFLLQKFQNQNYSKRKQKSNNNLTENKA